jgi:hypothetical protein
MLVSHSFKIAVLYVFTLSTGLLVVNEVANKDTDLDVCNGKAYIEFRNIATFPISISDLEFTLEVLSGSTVFDRVFVGAIRLLVAGPFLDEVIGLGAFLVLCRTTSGEFDFDIADGNRVSLRYTSNTYSPTGTRSQEIVLPLPGFGSPSATYQRLDDGSGFRYAFPTPGAANMFQEDDVRIVAFGVVQNQSGAIRCATGQEGVEIENFQPNPAALGALVLSDETGPQGGFVIPANTVIEAFGRFSFCKDPTDNGGFPFDVTAGNTVTLYDVRQPLEFQEVSTLTSLAPPISPAPALPISPAPSLPKTPAPSPSPVPLPGSVESAAAVALVGSIFGGSNTVAAAASDRGREEAKKVLDAFLNNFPANPTFPTFPQATNNNAFDAFLNNVPANPTFPSFPQATNNNAFDAFLNNVPANALPPGFRGGFRN